MTAQRRLSIGEFARLCRLTVVTLRHYDRVGLLAPAEVDKATGYRYYHADQVPIALRIGLLRSLDVPIAALRTFVDGAVSAGELLSAHRSRLTAQLHERQRMIDVIDALAAGADALPYEIVIGGEPDHRAVGLSIRTSWTRAERATRHALARLAVSARRMGIEPGATGALFPIEPNERTTITVFAEVDTVDLAPSLAPVDLASVDAISTVHHGDHCLLTYAYRALLTQAAAIGLEAVGPVREHYLTADDGVARTRLVIPIREHRLG